MKLGERSFAFLQSVTLWGHVFELVLIVFACVLFVSLLAWLCVS